MQCLPEFELGEKHFKTVLQCKFYFKFKSETTGIDGFCYET